MTGAGFEGIETLAGELSMMVAVAWRAAGELIHGYLYRTNQSELRAESITYADKTPWCW